MENTRSIAVAVIIYNQACIDSITCQTLKKLTLPVVLFDNSTKDMGNAQFCLDHGWVFLGGTGNVGLSKAYNACINYVKSANCGQILCLFDDDTTIDAGYFADLRNAIREPGNIYVPLVYSQKKLISPCLVDAGHVARTFSDESEALQYTGDFLSAINSGMAIDVSLFDDYQYDENIFLDGIDHKFLSDMRKRGQKIRVFPYRCKQNFSGSEKQSLLAAKRRFAIFAKDYRYILDGQKIAYFRLVGKRALKLTVLYRSMFFLRVFVQRDCCFKR